MSLWETQNLKRCLWNPGRAQDLGTSFWEWRLTTNWLIYPTKLASGFKVQFPKGLGHSPIGPWAYKQNYLPRSPEGIAQCSALAEMFTCLLTIIQQKTWKLLWGTAPTFLSLDPRSEQHTYESIGRLASISQPGKLSLSNRIDDLCPTRDPKGAQSQLQLLPLQ